MQVLCGSMRVSGANEVRKTENLINIGNGFANGHAMVNVKRNANMNEQTGSLDRRFLAELIPSTDRSKFRLCITLPRLQVHRQRVLHCAYHLRCLRRPVETSTPYYPSRRHEYQALHTSSDERYCTPTHGNSRYEQYSPTGRRWSEPTVRELGRLRGEPRPQLSAPRVISDVRFRDADRVEYAEDYIASSARYAETVSTRAKRVKQRVSFAPKRSRLLLLSI